MRLSLAMIVKNEQDTIIRCLESCYKIFDEIIIVDTGSTDKTKQFISEFINKTYANLLTYDFKWIDDFSAARNFSFSKCTGDWIFWLDADDIMPNPQVIRELIESVSKDTIAILLPYWYHVNDDGTPSITQIRERIIKRDEFVADRIKWLYPIHECLTIYDNNRCNISYESKHAIIHKRTTDSFTKDKTRNIEMLEKNLEKYATDHRYLFHYANELTYSGNRKKAIEIYEKMLTTQGFIEERYIGLMHLADCYKAEGKKDKCIEHLRKAIELCPFIRYAYYHLGVAYFEIEDFHSAISLLEIFKNGKFRSMLSAVHEELNEVRALEKLEFAYDKIGNYHKTMECAEKLLEDVYPGAPSLLHDVKYCKDRIIERYSSLMKPINGKLCINMGSGAQKIDGFYSCDKYDKKADFDIDMKFIPLKSKSVDVVRSEHSIEHLTFNNAVDFLKEAHRVLKAGGYLDLEVPDLQECYSGFMNAVNNDDILKANWYQMTMWGRQYTNGKIDLGQFHNCGFTKKFIVKIFEELGFYIQKADNSNKYGTPSINIIANRKPVVYFFDSGPIESATSRIRRKQLISSYYADGKSDTMLSIISVNSLDMINYELADAVIFTSFDADTVAKIKKCKELGIKTYYDHNESILDFPGVKEVLGMVDVVFCCTAKLKEITEIATGVKNCVILEDSYEITRNKI